MSESVYDLSALKERASRWRAEAVATTEEPMRAICLTAADRCERLVQMSLFTPVIREQADRPIL